MTWVLIMTLAKPLVYYPYATIATAEFNTEQACRKAGAQQESVLRNDLGIQTSKYYTFICVPKG